MARTRSQPPIPMFLRRLSPFATLLLLTACTESGDPTAPDPEGLDEAVQPLSDLSALLDGAPDNASLPEDGKFDAVYPATFDVADTLTPVRSQGRRGTCSIFAAIALMEQLYRAEGTLADPDFSEQWLQWSTKVELGIFRNTAGSNAGRNLDAIQRFGVPFESVWPYEASQWGQSQDAECAGEENLPTRCYTNGDPSEAQRAERRWTLPRGRYVNCGDRSIKAYMTEKNVGVIASVEFFYQSWNHGGSQLTTSAEYSRQGYVTYPSQADIDDSRQRPAGHAILLVGWDDTLEVPLLDGQGQPLLDDAGQPRVERGFFLFKNSWGTGRFGTVNPFGAGLGWISQRYVAEFGSCYSSTPPEVRVDAEVCDNGRDDDLDGAADCDDADCAAHPACAPPGLTRTVDANLAIPDADPTGVRSTVEIAQTGAVRSARVAVEITHTYRGDLEVVLEAPSGRTAVLHANTGGSEDDLRATFDATALVGVEARGTWSLIVRDTAAQDTGTLISWTLSLELGGELSEEICDNGVDDNGDGAADCADAQCLDAAACQAAESVTLPGETNLDIPDGDPAGVDSLIESEVPGTLSRLVVHVDIEHPNRGDLVIALEHESGVRATLFDREGGNEDDLVRAFVPAEFVGVPAAGLWMLTVADTANLDAGRVRSWSLEMVTR